MGPSAACNSACHNSHRHPPGHLVRPKTAGPWRPSHRLGPTIVSSSRSTADFPTPVRMESSGGTSSTPHTQNFERSASLPPSRPSPSPRAVTCPSGPATLRGTTRTSLDADHPASSRVHRPLPSLSAKRACLAMSAVEPIPRDQVGQGASSPKRYAHSGVGAVARNADQRDPPPDGSADAQDQHIAGHACAGHSVDHRAGAGLDALRVALTQIVN